jgi:GNAT superfamily N-acetyltransferase
MRPAAEIEELPMSPFTVRHAEPADFAVCRAFDFDHAPDEEIRYKIDRGELILAEHEGEAVGYLKLDWIGSFAPFVGLVFVKKAHRRKGAGRALLSFLAEKLRAMGKPWLLSSSEVMEPAPQAWHRHMGFHDAGILCGVNEDGSGEIFFRKAL